MAPGQLIGKTTGWATVPVAGLEVPIIPFRCTTCSKPIKRDFVHTTGACVDCHGGASVVMGDHAVTRGWALTVAVPGTEFPSYQLVWRAKEDVSLTKALIAVAAMFFADDKPWRHEGWTPDVVVPCPASKGRLVPRSSIMASEVGGILGCPWQDPLVRVDDNGPRHTTANKQMPSTFAEVQEHVNIEARGYLNNDERVLLVDDMRTQGTTAASAAHALRQAGASDVRLLSFAIATTENHLQGYCD